MAGYARKELSFAAHAACGNAEQRRTEGCITQVRRTRTRTQVRCTSHCASLAPRMGPVYRPKFAQVCLRRNVPHFGQRAIDAQSVGNSCDAICSVSSGPIFIETAQLVVTEVEARQRAIDTQSIGNCCDALCSVGAAIWGHSAEYVVGEVQARQRACDTGL